MPRGIGCQLDRRPCSLHLDQRRVLPCPVDQWLLRPVHPAQHEKRPFGRRQTVRFLVRSRAVALQIDLKRSIQALSALLPEGRSQGSVLGRLPETPLCRLAGRRAGLALPVRRLQEILPPHPQVPARHGHVARKRITCVLHHGSRQRAADHQEVNVFMVIDGEMNEIPICQGCPLFDPCYFRARSEAASASQARWSTVSSAIRAWPSFSFKAPLCCYFRLTF